MTSDALVGASIPIVVGFTVWVVKSFIQQTVGPTGSRGEKGDQGEAGVEGVITVKDYKGISNYIKKDLNGRYMMRLETLEKFSELHSSVAVLHEKVSSNNIRLDQVGKSLHDLRNFIMENSAK